LGKELNFSIFGQISKRVVRKCKYVNRASIAP